MASERTLKAVSRPLVLDGTVDGVLTVDKAKYFKVKARVLLKSSTQPIIALEVKAVPSHTTIVVGPPGSNMQTRTDVSAYKVADGAVIQQQAQPRAAIAQGDIDRSTYEEEPTVARRVTLVDEYGDLLDVDNPLPVQLSDGTINIENVNANVSVQLTDKDNWPNSGDIHDAVRIGDGVDELLINPDGSINVHASIGAVGAAYPHIVNVPMPIANTEYSVTLPKATTRFLLRMRNASSCHVAYVVGETFTNYVTMNFGVVYQESDLALTAVLTLYLQASRPGEVAEVVYWT